MHHVVLHTGVPAPQLLHFTSYPAGHLYSLQKPLLSRRFPIVGDSLVHHERTNNIQWDTIPLRTVGFILLGHDTAVIIYEANSKHTQYECNLPAGHFLMYQVYLVRKIWSV